MSAKIDALFAGYAAHHRTAGNVGCHLIGIPMIAFGLIGLLAVEVYRFPFKGDVWPVELSPLLVLAIAPVYLWLDARLGAAVTALYLAMYLGARQIGWPAHAGLFAAGWVFQFIGHMHYEKRSPAFFTNLLHLFVGPLWVLNHLLRWRSVSALQ